ncbi:type IX secretion system anionic LPS delivery protein PorZ [Hymenobacter jeollabukensis]|uniref:T9SS type A sorting domain-containing protein n=1 Tax=Hymenobacter jeollabukensis TaxID=2025313 RepID=A0A5R8WIM3_9BACT|nr:T9SS type A sorting domain-containing protein [Hymenobacter jeollabukensis]TLM88573.1 T9SS type A sorting domain-containing protein [Hymenobacter jeollabukensis]
MTKALRTALLAGLGLVAAASSALAQRTAGYGDWQLHLPTNRTHVLADAGPRVYAAAEDAFFVFDKETSSVQLLSRRDGLSDVSVRALAYDSLTQQVVVVYRSGQVDILNNKGRVTASLSDIKRKSLAGGKTINRVDVARRLAYVSTNFGIVVLDLQRFEVKDTYSNFGPGGTAPQVYGTAVQGDTLYAATSAGLLRGNLNTNLLNYNNWRSTAGFGARNGDPYRTLVTHRGKVYAGINDDNLYRAVGAGWVSLNYPVRTCWALRSSAAGLLVSEDERIGLIDTRTNQVRNRIQLPSLTAGRDAIRPNSGPLYIADFRNGLIRVEANGQNATSFVTNAPATTNAFNIVTDPVSKTATVLSGGYAEGYVQLENKLGFYVYDADGRWTNVNAQNYTSAEYPNLQDVSRGARTPDGTLYVASYAQGLLEWKGPGQFRVFGVDNSPLRSAIRDLQDPNYPRFVRVTDVAAAPNGDVWLVNRHQVEQQPGVFRFTPSTGQWQSIPWFTGAENLERLCLDDLGHLWLGRARRALSGLVAYNPETNALRSFAVSDGLPNGTVWDLVKDRRGAIWAATSEGAAVYDDPSLAFEPGATGFRTPIVRRGAGTGFRTLWTEVVKCIAVDGGNRKWFGTDNGLWLFNEDGDEALQHFTVENSPLPSNRIVDVAVDDRTGEVWVATEAGVVSYRGSATVTEGAPSCAKVFPNPVRQDFSGQVGISGLANNAEVKITDITGTLVYQTRATGGTVVWNLADYNGRRVQSGVYLVLTADSDGKNGCISKVAVLTK